MTQEPKSRSPRIEIEPMVWPALQVEAITRRMSPKDLVNMLIMEALSPKAREFMEPMESNPHDLITPRPIATERPMIPQPHEPIRRESTVADISQKRKRLAEDTDALSRLKEMWKAGEKSPTVISKAINYPRSTISETIKRMRASGELVD